MQKKQFIISVIGLLTLTLGACSTPYPCGEPGTGQCKSVTQNYQQSYQNYTNPDDLNANGSSGTTTATQREDSSSSSQTVKEYMRFQQYPQIPANGAPILSQPKMMRVWLSPYTDNDNIYHDQSYEYIIVSRGSWNYNNNKILLDEDGLQNVTQGQVSNTRQGGYGAYGNLDQPPIESQPKSNLTAQFPAINGLQNGQIPIVTTTVGSGIDRTTQPIPY